MAQSGDGAGPRTPYEETSQVRILLPPFDRARRITRILRHPAKVEVRGSNPLEPARPPCTRRLAWKWRRASNAEEQGSESPRVRSVGWVSSDAGAPKRRYEGNVAGASPAPTTRAMEGWPNRYGAGMLSPSRFGELGVRIPLPPLRKRASAGD